MKTRIGTALWLLTLAVLQPPLATSVLLLATLVVVPLALEQALPPEATRGGRFAARWQTVAAALLVGSCALEQGPLAACLAGPWFAATALVALDSVWRWLTSPRRSLTRWGFDLALVYLAVGGLWTVITRSGWRPLDFSAPIVELTAVHFHYAGFALLVLSALAAQELRGTAARGALMGAALGVPLLAAGISLSRPLELAAAGLLCASGALVAGGQLRLATRATTPGPLVLFGISGASLLGGMALAVAYACSHYQGHDWIDIPRMVATHGLLNALGFALCGLWAWHATSRQPVRPATVGDSTSGPAEKSRAPRPLRTA